MVVELISLKDVSSNSKILLLKELGYQSDGVFILDKEGKKVVDKYLEVPVKLDNMVILPGSEIILEDNEFSIASYLEEYGEDAL